MSAGPFGLRLRHEVGDRTAGSVDDGAASGLLGVAHCRSGPLRSGLSRPRRPYEEPVTLNSGLSHHLSSLVLRFWNTNSIASSRGHRVAPTRRFGVHTVTGN